MTDEEKKEYEKLKSLLYTGTISQYGKRKLIDMFEKQQKEIEELKKPKYLLNAKTGEITTINNSEFISKDKIKAKIEEVDIQLQKLKDGLTGRKTNFVNKNMLFAQKKVLQSLLEKE